MSSCSMLRYLVSLVAIESIMEYYVVSGYRSSVLIERMSHLRSLPLLKLFYCVFFMQGALNGQQLPEELVLNVTVFEGVVVQLEITNEGEAVFLLPPLHTMNNYVTITRENDRPMDVWFTYCGTSMPYEIIQPGDTYRQEVRLDDLFFTQLHRQGFEIGRIKLEWELFGVCAGAVEVDL